MVRQCRQLTDVSIMSIAQHCPGIEILDVGRCDWSRLTDASILAIADGCPELRSLDITNCSNITGKAVLVLLGRCTKLCTVIFSSIIETEEFSVSQIIPNNGWECDYGFLTNKTRPHAVNWWTDSDDKNSVKRTMFFK
jgi:hypothetical protein